MMRKPFQISLIIICILLLTACSENSSRSGSAEYIRGYDDGYESGQDEGRKNGYDEAKSDLEERIREARKEGYDQGFSDGFSAAEENGTYDDGYDQGYADGKADGNYGAGYAAGFAEGKTEGYSSGYTAGQQRENPVYASTGGKLVEASTPSRSSESNTVYVSRNGVIHNRSNCSGMKYYTEMTYAEAVASGYRFCSKCY